MSSDPGQPCDIISNLPENVKETIQMCLPTEDAVRMSILSTKWRYSWTKLPQLSINGHALYKFFLRNSNRALLIILCHMMLLHEGDIKKFSVIDVCPNYPGMDFLILFLSRNGIEDLKLELSLGSTNCYTLPSSFYRCQQLRHLNLRACLIKNTTAFQGFSRLRTLKLCRLTITDEMLTSLISGCPLLELLDLRAFFRQVEIEIDAPNLKTFRSKGDNISIILINTPLLSSVKIDKYSPKCIKKRGSNLVELFQGLPRLEYLEFGYRCYEFPTRCHTTLDNLKDLELFLANYDQLGELSFILFLIRSSPNLRNINIKFQVIGGLTTKAVLEFLKEQDYSDMKLDKLKNVKLHNVSPIGYQLEFIKLLLAISPSLETMLIWHYELEEYQENVVLKELTKFRRASKEAEVIYQYETYPGDGDYVRDI